MVDGDRLQDLQGSSDGSQDRRRAWRESACIAVAAVVAVGAGILGLWVSSTTSIRQNYNHYLVGMAEAAAQQIDPVLHQNFRDPAQRNGPEYRRTVAPLRRLRMAVADIRYIYTAVADGTDVRFVLDAADAGDHDGDGLDDQAGIWEVYDDADPTIWAALGRDAAAGHAVATAEPYSDKWGSFMTGWAPIRDASARQIAVVGVDVDATVYLDRMAAARNWALLGIAPAGLLIMVLCVAFWHLRLRGLVAARVLALEQERLKHLIEGTSVGTWDWDIASGDVVINDRWAAMLGYRADEMLPLTTQKWRLLFHPDDFECMYAAVETSLASPGQVFETDFRMRHADGHWVWISSHGNVIERDAAGRGLRMAGINVDISARKEAELALKDSERKFRSLFELSPVGIALNDLHTGRFLQVNDALLAPSGYSREELLRLTYWDVTPASYGRDEQVQLESMETTARYGPYEKEYMRKDGSCYPVLLSGIRMTDAGGREVIWSIVQDISQRKAMESELAAAARCDKLTGLANRTLFMERLQEVIDRVQAGAQHSFAVLFLDFDHFKLINDALGHEAGDELLRQIATRLRGLAAQLRYADRRQRRQSRLPDSAAMNSWSCSTACTSAPMPAGSPSACSTRWRRPTTSMGATCTRPRASASSPASRASRAPRRWCATPTWPCTRPSAPAAPAAWSSTKPCTRG